MQRYFVPKCDEELVFEKNVDEYYHLTKVLRSKIGMVVELCSEEKCYRYVINLIDKDKIILQRQEEILKIQNSNKIILAISLLKNNNFELVLQKAVECGVDVIVPFESKRTVVKADNFSANKFARFRKIIKEAAEQSKRNNIPEIFNVCSIKELIEIESSSKYVAYECDYNDKNKLLISKQRSDVTLIVIGPEGGFETSEIDYLVDNGFETVSLGSYILRAETAAITAVNLLNNINYRGE